MPSSNSSLESWALPRLQNLLPLDEESLRQVITYADTLPKDAAAEHLKNFLGEEPASLEFIEGFNLRRQQAPQTAAPSNAGSASTRAQQSTSTDQPQTWKPTPGGRPRKKKANIHALPARQLEDRGDASGAYRKRNEEEYMPASVRQRHKDQIAENLALRAPDATQMPLITDSAAPSKQPVTAKPPPSAAGALISDALAPKKKSSSRTSSPSPAKAKVNISGGTAMHGASTALSDLDSAIRRLELQTNPTLTSTDADDLARRRCPCMAARHPLLDIAPNCLACGKIICVKEGLGPCTFCGSALLRPDELASVLRVLKAERGDERTRINNAAHRRADVAQGKPRAFTGRDFLAAATAAGSSTSPLSSSAASSARASPVVSDTEPDLSAPGDDRAAAATAHRDKLLTFQANNARRTRVHDEAADFDLPSAGTNMWASPAERAQQLKRQQKLMREMEWNARPEYEKRKVVASIDLVGGRVVRRMAEVERPDFGAGAEEDHAEEEGRSMDATAGGGNGAGAGGAFSRNPLAKGLIKPIAREAKGKEKKELRREKGTLWRRVQMDGDDNEQWILDGGVYGGQTLSDRVLGDEEHAVGS